MNTFVITRTTIESLEIQANSLNDAMILAQSINTCPSDLVPVECKELLVIRHEFSHEC